MKEVYCAKDRTSALEKAGPFLQGKYHDYRRWGQDKVMPDNENFAKTLSNLARDRFILGSPDDCYDQLRPYWEEFGINHLLIRTHWAGMPAELSFESMELLSKELLPRLRAI